MARAADGILRWQQGVGEPGAIALYRQPVVCESIVYVETSSGRAITLRALRIADVGVIGEQTLPGWQRGSHAVDGSLLLIAHQVRGQELTMLSSSDRSTGVVLWQDSFRAQGTAGHEMIILGGGNTYFTLSDDLGVTAARVDDGAMVWKALTGRTGVSYALSHS